MSNRKCSNRPLNTHEEKEVLCEYDGCRFYFEGLEHNCARKECPYPGGMNARGEGEVNMEARPRPPRKFFFSVLGTPSPITLTFQDEPRWEKRGKGDALVATILRKELIETEEMEQFAPDANDLSVALVQALGGTVAGKSCRIALETKPVPSRKTGGIVQVISKFVVQPT